MDDYHEFRHVHDIQIEEWQLYWSSNYVSIITKIVAPSGALATFCINSASGNKSGTGTGAIESGGTTGGGGVGASFSTPDPLLIYNPIVEFHLDDCFKNNGFAY